MDDESHTLASLSQGNRPSTHFKRGCVGPTAGIDGCGKCRFHRESITGPFNTLRVPIQTDLSRPKRGMITVMIFMKSLSFMTLHFEALRLNSMGRPTSFVQYIREEYCAVCNQIIFGRQITQMSLLSCPWTWHVSHRKPTSAGRFSVS